MTTSLSDARWSSGDPNIEATAPAAAPRSAPSPLVNPAAPAPTPATTARPTPSESASSGAADEPDDERRSILPPLASLNDLVRHAPAWLFSAVLHMLVLIVMALLLIARPGNSGLLIELSPHESYGEDLEPGELDIALDLEELNADDAALESELVDLEPNEAQVTPTAPLGLDPAPAAPPIRRALSGRQAGMKASLLAAYGGTADTENAVEEGLRWLERNQDSKTGLWNLSGKFANGVNRDNPDAATAMALLAFQGAGYTPDSDPREPFQRTVTRAWNALLKRQQDNGNFFNSGTSHGTLYTHAIATIALCELYGMTSDEQYRDAAQKAVDYCVATQSAGGGWRYFPGQDGDLSVTGWFVMALQSAQMAGLYVPSETLTQISTFLDTVSRDGGSQYSYTPGLGRRMSMTAEGLLCRQYLGWKRTDPRLIRGADLLIQQLPSWDERNAYYWYYAAQVCHHMEGRHWREWNKAMRTVLPARQVKQGRERGSWDPVGDPGNTQGGRHFVTCLSIFMLEVYYRHLPIYQSELFSGD